MQHELQYMYAAPELAYATGIIETEVSQSYLILMSISERFTRLSTAIQRAQTDRLP